eukprot:364577-Chlamydomonas_euryale.AAC.11
MGSDSGISTCRPDVCMPAHATIHRLNEHVLLLALHVQASGLVPPHQEAHATTRYTVDQLSHLPCACKPKITDLEVARCIEQQVAWLQIAVQHVGTVHVLQATQHLHTHTCGHAQGAGGVVCVRA